MGGYNSFIPNFLSSVDIGLLPSPTSTPPLQFYCNTSCPSLTSFRNAGVGSRAVRCMSNCVHLQSLPLVTNRQRGTQDSRRDWGECKDSTGRRQDRLLDLFVESGRKPGCGSGGAQVRGISLFVIEPSPAYSRSVQDSSWSTSESFTTLIGLIRQKKKKLIRPPWSDTPPAETCNFSIATNSLIMSRRF